jgi:hypothetical protein
LRVILVVFFPLFQCQVWFDPVKTWRRHLREVQSSHSNPKGSGSFTLEAGASNTAIQGKVAKRNPPPSPPRGGSFLHLLALVAVARARKNEGIKSENLKPLAFGSN